MNIRYLDFIEREDLSILLRERERVCVSVKRHFYLNFAKKDEYHNKITPQKNKKNSTMNNLHASQNEPSFFALSKSPSQITIIGINSFVCQCTHASLSPLAHNL